MECGWEGTRTEVGSYETQAGEKLGRPRSGQPQELWKRGSGTSSKVISKNRGKSLDPGVQGPAFYTFSNLLSAAY